MKSILAYLSKEKVILGVYVIVSIIIGIQHLHGGPDHYNNFRIFRAGLWHLLEHKNLHLEYPKEYFDLFLYNPSFCILFAPFTIMPEGPALLCWTVFCSVVLFYAISKMPMLHGQKVFFWWYILFELITSLHNQQTNPLIAAFALFTFSLLEKGKTKWAALFPMLAFFIKGYGLIFAALFLFYPNKGKYIGYSLLWGTILALLPLPVTGVSYFIEIYKDWLALLIQDHDVNYGYSVMGLLKVWIPSLSPSGATNIQVIGLVLLAATWAAAFFRRAYNSQFYKLLLLAYLFLWVILFNHASESPTYVIAICGVILFYIADRDLIFPWSKMLIILVFLFSILAPTDIYPPYLRQHFFVPYLIKVIPCLLVWSVLQIQLLSSRAN